jgi:hypothetical protein
MNPLCWLKLPEFHGVGTVKQNTVILMQQNVMNNVSAHHLLLLVCRNTENNINLRFTSYLQNYFFIFNSYYGKRVDSAGQNITKSSRINILRFTKSQSN